MKVMFTAAWIGFLFGLFIFVATWFFGVPVDRARSYGVGAAIVVGVIVILINIGVFFYGVNEDRKKRNAFKRELEELEKYDV